LENSVEWAVVDDEPGWLGGDTRHALSAWTSISRDLTDEKRARIPKLLEFLAANGHTTPFEKSYLQFLITCDLATHIHILKHRIGVSVNAESARYKELKDDKFYIPRDWPVDLQDSLEAFVEQGIGLYHDAIDYLVEKGYNRARAKESARYFLPYANQLTMDVAFNFNSFVHFQKLRNAPDAQLEVRQIADRMLQLVRETGKFEHSLRAFNLIGD
jgi:thymidylate synthase (FAD)